MKGIRQEKASAKRDLTWIAILFILLVKSEAVVASLVPLTPYELVYGILAITPLILLISFSFLFSGRRHLLFLAGLDLFISLLFIADIIYGRAFGSLISVHMMLAKDVISDLDAGIISLVRWTDFLMLSDIPFLFVFAVKRKKSSDIRGRSKLFVFAIVLCLLGVCIQFKHLEDSKMLGNTRLLPILMSPVGNHLYDFYRFFYEKRDSLSVKDINAINAWLAENAKYQKPDEGYASLKGVLKEKNLIIIQFESLENMLIGKSYFGHEITPNINRLLLNSIYFNHIHEQVKDGNSSDAELLTLTSTYPISDGSAFLRFGGNNYFSLPKLLKEDGYTSIAIHGDDKEFWNRDRVYEAMGFEKYVTEEQFKDKSSFGMGILDKSLFSQSIDEMKKLKQPFSILIITITSHMPFELNPDMRYFDFPEDDVTSRYLQSIHYTDKMFGEFYEKLKHEGLLNNSALIIYGDHEGLHKYYKTTLPNNNYEIPFIVHIPGMAGFKLGKTGGQVDIMPTLAFLLGIDADKYNSNVMGRNLFGEAPGAVILPTGKILGEERDREHLESAQNIADHIIKGNYNSSMQGK